MRSTLTEVFFADDKTGTNEDGARMAGGGDPAPAHAGPGATAGPGPAADAATSHAYGGEAEPG